VPLEADFEQQLLIVRQDLQWYVDHCQGEKDIREPNTTTNGTQKHDKTRSEEEVKIIKPEDAEILAIALVGEKAKRMVNEAQIEAGEITEIARKEADEMLRNVRHQCDVMLHEVSEKLRAALGILSQPQHAKPPRNTAGK
jgi:DNA anti-recombination protein RmuC